MKLNEIIVNEGIGDSLRSGMYKLTGYGGNPANQSATKIKFINDLKQQIRMNQESAKRAGMPFDMNQYVDSYLAKYNAKASDEQKENLKTLSNNPDKFANYMYNILSQQVTNSQGYVTGQNTGPSMGGGMTGNKTGGTDATPEEKLSPATEKVIDAIAKLTGTANFDDLKRIAKTAMQILYKQNPAAYTELYKEILGGDTKQGLTAKDIADRRLQKQRDAAGQADRDSTEPVSRANSFDNMVSQLGAAGENPNIVRGTNESKRRR
jgi:hypothetical protein